MDKRFIIKESKNEKFTFGTYTVVDKETGVQYLYVSAGYGAGLTVLVDAEGKPLLGRSLD